MSSTPLVFKSLISALVLGLSSAMSASAVAADPQAGVERYAQMRITAGFNALNHAVRRYIGSNPGMAPASMDEVIPAYGFHPPGPGFWSVGPSPDGTGIRICTGFIKPTPRDRAVAIAAGRAFGAAWLQGSQCGLGEGWALVQDIPFMPEAVTGPESGSGNEEHGGNDDNGAGDDKGSPKDKGPCKPKKEKPGKDKGSKTGHSHCDAPEA